MDTFFNLLNCPLLDNRFVLDGNGRNYCNLKYYLKQDDGVKASLSSAALKELANGGGDKLMIRTISIPGELHGAPDPVAADILRKEPEQETFVRLEITPIGIPMFTFSYLCSLISQNTLTMPKIYVHFAFMPFTYYSMHMYLCINLLHAYLCLYICIWVKKENKKSLG